MDQAPSDNSAPSRLWNGWIARMLGRVEARAAPVQDSAHTDTCTSLYNYRGLLIHAEELVARYRRQGRAVSLVVFDCSDLMAAREVYGSATTRKLIDYTVQKFKALAGRNGLAARTGPAQFTVALPLGREHVMQELVRVLGSPARIEFDSDGSEIVLVPNFLVGSLTDGASVGKLHATLTLQLSRLQQEEQRRHSYLQRKREQHSRPAALEPLRDDAAAPAAKPVPARRLKPVAMMAPIPSTMPMRLAAR
jgi:GGDEF domain-containing protein